MNGIVIGGAIPRANDTDEHIHDTKYPKLVQTLKIKKKIYEKT